MCKAFRDKERRGREEGQEDMRAKEEKGKKDMKGSENLKEGKDMKIHKKGEGKT